MDNTLALKVSQTLNNIYTLPLKINKLEEIFKRILLEMRELPWSEQNLKSCVYLSDYENKNLKLIAIDNIEKREQSILFDDHISKGLFNILINETDKEIICGKVRDFITGIDQNKDIYLQILRKGDFFLGTLIVILDNEYNQKQVEKDFLKEIALFISYLVDQRKILNFSQKQAQKEALEAIVTTYNHEINNPLSVAMAYTFRAKKTFVGLELDNVISALQRIVKVLDKIKNISQMDFIKFKNYGQDIGMMELANLGSIDGQIANAIHKTFIVSMTDSNGKITYANNHFCDVSKFSRDELLGKDHRIINSGHHSKEFFKSMWKILQNGAIYRGNIKNKAKNGRFYWVDSIILPLFYNEKTIKGYLSIRNLIKDKD